MLKLELFFQDVSVESPVPDDGSQAGGSQEGSGGHREGWRSWRGGRGHREWAEVMGGVEVTGWRSRGVGRGHREGLEVVVGEEGRERGQKWRGKQMRRGSAQACLRPGRGLPGLLHPSLCLPDRELLCVQGSDAARSLAHTGPSWHVLGRARGSTHLALPGAAGQGAGGSLEAASCPQQWAHPWVTWVPLPGAGGVCLQLPH